MRRSGAAFGQWGATLLEFAVAAVVVGTLAAVLLQRMFYVQEYSEKLAMESMITNLRTALRVRVGELLIADRAAEISTLAGANPIDWLQSRPTNYFGAVNGSPNVDPRGQWYFDVGRSELVYTAHLRNYFMTPTDADYTVRLKIRPISAGTGPVSRTQPEWVRLAVMNEYTWF